MYLFGEVPIPNEYEFMDFAGIVRGPNPRLLGPGRRRTGLRERAAARPRVGAARKGAARRGHRPPPRQHPLRQGEPHRRPRLLDRRDPRATSSVSSASASPRRSLRRSTSPSSPTPAASSTRTRRPRHSVSPPSSWRREPTCTASSRACTRTSPSPSSSSSRARSRTPRSSREGAWSSPTSNARTSRHAGAEEPYSEGIIDYLRAVEGTELAALIREPPTANGPTHRISLRTTEADLDVSAIARKSGGGGHRQAAGFSSEASIEEITEFIRREFLAQVNGKEPR